MELTDQVRRYLLVYDIIKKRGPISLKELMQEVESRSALFTKDVACSRSTILRTVDALKADACVESGRKGYWLADDQVEDRWLLDSLQLLDSIYYDKSIGNFVLSEQTRLKGTEHLRPLVRAIKNSLRVKFRYRKYDNTSEHVRTVEPYAIKEYRRRWYLLAKEVGGRIEEAGEIKTWGLDRIEGLILTGDRFPKDRALDVAEEFRNSTGIYSNRELPVEEVVLSFPPMGGRYNAAFPLHESQETILENDEEFRIRLRVRITYDFVMELLSQTQDMTVIAPQHLKDELTAIYRDAIERMKK